MASILDGQMKHDATISPKASRAAQKFGILHNYKVVISHGHTRFLFFSVLLKKITLLLLGQFPRCCIFPFTPDELSAVDCASSLRRSPSVRTHPVKMPGGRRDRWMDGRTDRRSQSNNNPPKQREHRKDIQKHLPPAPATSLPDATEHISVNIAAGFLVRLKVSC